ncbi:radical SAM protein [bacterium]|nr:radical SAM protein [bacterium]
MVPEKLTFRKKINGFFKYVSIKTQERPVLMNLEVTKRCNARCDFCDYWKTKDKNELEDYLPIVKKIDPLVLAITGGEPTLRRDLVDIVRRIKENVDTIYISMISHGYMLTEEKAKELYEAGLDQICISVDYIGERHEISRGLKGLWNHLEDLIPKLGKIGFQNVALNTIIMNDNLDEIIPLVHKAKEWGVKIGFSSYTSLKVGNDSHYVVYERQAELEKIIKEILRLKGELKNVMSSDFYLENIPSYFSNRALGDCQAGKYWVQVTPDGYIKHCSEFPIFTHYSEYNYKEIVSPDCDKCWYSCRGESQAPFSFKRVYELVTQ